MTTYKPHYGKSCALVIGIDKYSYVSQLDNARFDAESVAAVCFGELGFAPENVISLLDEKATREKIMESYLAFESSSPDDRLLVFFAGHGITVPGNRGEVGYLVPVDGDPGNKSTLIRWMELTSGAEIIPAKHIFFIMDACYSGLAIQ